MKLNCNLPVLFYSLNVTLRFSYTDQVAFSGSQGECYAHALGFCRLVSLCSWCHLQSTPSHTEVDFGEGLTLVLFSFFVGELNVNNVSNEWATICTTQLTEGFFS